LWHIFSPVIYLGEWYRNSQLIEVMLFISKYDQVVVGKFDFLKEIAEVVK